MVTWEMKKETVQPTPYLFRIASQFTEIDRSILQNSAPLNSSVFSRSALRSLSELEKESSLANLCLTNPALYKTKPPYEYGVNVHLLKSEEETETAPELVGGEFPRMSRSFSAQYNSQRSLAAALVLPFRQKVTENKFLDSQATL